MDVYNDLELQLNQYVDSNQSGAFLISGPWGSGKTFSYTKTRSLIS